jgi:chorismate mutase
VNGQASEQGTQQLHWLRSEIERIDRAIIDLITERVGLALRVGEIKRAAGLPTLDPPREAAIVRRAGALARDAGLDDEVVRDVFWRLIRLSRDAQVDEA